MRKYSLSLSLSLGLTLIASAAQAQIDSAPLPPFTQHVYSVPGVVNTGNLGTYFACTNVGTLSTTVGVEVFGPAGGAGLNDPATTAISVAPGATVLFGSQNAFGLSIDANLAPGPVSKGSARILATSKSIACTAYLAASNVDPPTSGWQLTIIAKLKQKAAN